MKRMNVQELFAGFSALFVLALLYVSSLYNYLLFHSMAEGFSIVIACGLFMVAWNTRRYNPDNYLLLIGIAYLFVAVLDFVHTLSYEGMNIFPGFDANAPTQLWIAARYMESLTLLFAPFLSHRRIRTGAYFMFYGAVTVAVFLSIFYWRIFPDAFLPEAGGLTPFKKISEYIVCVILLVSGALFVYRRDHFDSGFLKWALMAVSVTIAAELSFTTYADVFGFSNLIGHFLKIVSFYLMYKAVIETGLAKPYDLLFGNLRRQSDLLRVTLTSIGDAVIATDTAGRITFMNKMAEDLTGWGMPEAVDKPVQEVFRIINEHTRAAVQNPISRVLRNGITVGLANHTVLLRKGGGEVPIDDSGAPIQDEGGRILGAVLVFRDISERRRAEEALRQAQKMESIGRLAGGVAHEINNMLNVINGNAELLGLRLEKESPLLKYVREITGASLYAADISDRLRLYSSDSVNAPKEIDLNRELHHRLKMLEDLVGESVRVHFSPDKSVWPVRIDPAQLEQVLVNLALNARDAIADTGDVILTTGNVRTNRFAALADLPPGDYVRLSFTDTGTGMSRETRERIFDPFFTTRDVGRGTGMGLAAVYGIIKQNSGGISVESEPGKGTEFAIYFPRSRAEDGIAESTSV